MYQKVTFAFKVLDLIDLKFALFWPCTKMRGFTVLNWYQRIEFSIETRKKTINKNLISSFFLYIYIFKNVI